MSHPPTRVPAGTAISERWFNLVLRVLNHVLSFSRDDFEVTKMHNKWAIKIRPRPVVGRSSGGGIPIVAVLPQLPTPLADNKARFVFWGSVQVIEGGTGDNQIWGSGPLNNDWAPVMDWTGLDGTPVPEP